MNQLFGTRSDPVDDAQVPAGGFRWPSLVEIIHQELTGKK